jgi:anti-sigma B factor antagonist
MIENPPIPDFRCEVRPARDRVILALEGELDLATAPVVAQEIEQLHEAGFRTFVIDLRGLLYMDSSGVEMLFRWSQRPDTTVRLEHVPPTIERLLTLVGFIEA